MENSANHPDLDDPEADEQEYDYYRRENAAAPDAGHALYFNHPQHGWMPVLDQFTDIEISRVVIALGDAKTGAFAALFDTYYSEYADLIFDANTVTGEFSDAFREDLFTPADELVVDLPESTPGESNLSAIEDRTA